jgi:putative glycosyltransferase (TIGR04348 family)
LQGRHVLIVSPASATDNNGNWQTASRWARFLRGEYRVSVASAWHAGDAPPDLLIALHARRSAPSLAAFNAAHPQRPTVLVLTGTDIYRDIKSDPEAQASLHSASVLVVLQDAALAMLPPKLQARTRVIYQSASPLQPHRHPMVRRHFDFCMVGHLRPEKDPLTFMAASDLVSLEQSRFLHIGAAIEPALGQAALRTQEKNPRYRWLGGMGRAAARQRIKRCHAMVIASMMEGGANVIIEAVTSGVPVLASDINGNRGMLGEDYAGYFPQGDAAALARLIERSIVDPDFYRLLCRQCDARAALFAPDAERTALLELVDNLLLPKSAHAL